MLTRQDFESRVTAQADAARALGRGKRFSDLSDADGHQYIDLVMEGGGTLGMALLGYVHVLEQAGLRFIGIGGTSAGAISAIALAAAGRPAEPRVERMIEVVADMPMRSFVDGRQDGDDDAWEAVESWLQKRSGFSRVWKGAQVLDNLRDLDGLNRGEAFRAWMHQTLCTLNGGAPLTVAGLRRLMTDAPPLLVAETAREDDFAGLPVPPYERLSGGQRVVHVDRQRDQLCVVTADISTETKVELPRCAQLFWPEPDGVDVAEFARASMSIPGFFAPYRLPSLPVDVATKIWQEVKPGLVAKARGPHFLPKQHCFVDGGVLSNFPINAFHNPKRVPLRPTFGIKLQWDETAFEVENLVDIARQCFNSARHALDVDFIDRNPDFSRLVSYIDTGDINWLDFNMDDETKLHLFELGADSALAFIQGFDWEAYKEVRRLLLKANQAD